MNFLLALTASIFYALQAVLTAKIARSHDALFAQALRGISFGVTMLPLLLLGLYFDDGSGLDLLINNNIWFLLLAIVFAGVGNWCIALSNVHLPVAYGSTIGTSIATIMVGLVGILYFHDQVSFNQILLILVLVLTNFIFLLQKEFPVSQLEFKPISGYIFAFFYGIFIALAFSLVAKLSRDTHPFIIAYLWEFGIGIFLCFLMYIRKIMSKKIRLKADLRTIKLLSIYSSPTVVGTAAYAYALKLGPIPTVAAVHNTVLIFIAIFSAFIFHERLSIKRWIIIFFIFNLLILIKVL